MQFLFILNPISGPNRDPQKIKAQIHATFSNSPHEYFIRETDYPKHATELAEKAVKDKIDVVVAIGGDGTINEVGRALRFSETSLGIIPAGSGNGFARHLNIPLNQLEAIKVLLTTKKQQIDTGMIAEHPFMGISGTGFDAHVGELFSHTKTRGPLPYIKHSIRAFFSYRPLKYTIETENESFETEAFLISFANSTQFGNGAKIAPFARSDNGELDICILHPLKLFQVVPLAIKLFRGTLKNSESVRYLKGKSFKISTTENMKIHFDGEPLSVSHSFEVKVLEKSLYVLAP